MTRKEALATGAKRYFTGKPCLRGHIDQHWTGGGCVTCAHFTATRWQEAHPGKNRDRARKWVAANPNKRKAGKAKLRAAKLHRTPPWADLDTIQAFYTGCPAGHHVDHEIPLQGELISGLHVLENLQYLPATENMSKGNRIDLAAPELL